MDFYSATEQAYKNGYEQGYKEGLAVSKLEAEKEIESVREEYRRLKAKYFPRGGDDA